MVITSVYVGAGPGGLAGAGGGGGGEGAMTGGGGASAGGGKGPGSPGIPTAPYIIMPAPPRMGAGAWVSNRPACM